ncbi:MAG: ScyD/ScyE family protein, partial [Chloroflexota bacterium]
YNLMTGGGTFREAATVRERYDAGIVVDIVTYFKNHLPHGLMQLRYLAGAVDERAGALAYILDPTLWLYGGLALAGLIYCARRGAPLLLLMTLSSFLIMPYFNQRKYVPISDGRYLMPLLPLAYAATGTLLATGWNRLRDRDPAWRYGMIAGAALLVLYPLAPLTRYYGQELAAGRTNEPLLRVVQEVGANRRPDEPVVLDRDLADIKLEGGGTAFRSIRFLLAGIGIDDRSVDSVTDYAEKMPPGTSALLVTDSRGVKHVQEEADRLRAVGVQTETAVPQRVDGDYAAIRLEHVGPAAQANDGSQHAQFPTAYSAPLGRSGLSVYAAPGTARLDQTGQSHTSGGEPMAAPEAKAEDNQDAKPTSTVPIELFATSLVNPRGLAFRDDRSLLVALAGNGGPNEIDVGRDKPHRYGRTGELIRIDPTGDKFIMARNLPSIVTAVNEECGPSAVAFIEDRTYLLMASGGWDFGDPAFHSGVYELEPEGGLRKIWDMTEHVLANPAKARREDPRADVPAGMAYGMTAMGGRLYVTDANQEQLFEVDPSTGSARQVVEYPKSNRAMTGVAAGPDGALYVAEWASNKITRITTDGHISDGATKLRMPIGVTFGPDGAMYVVEFTGRVLRAAPVGEEQKDILAEGLRAPTAIAFGPDGNLYVSVRGQGSGQGEGEIIRLRLTPPDPNIERARWANAAAWMSGLLVFFLLLGTGWISQWRARRLRRNQPPGPPTA